MAGRILRAQLPKNARRAPPAPPDLPDVPDPRSESQLRDPAEISTRLLDLEQEFDPALLERMSAWMAVTTGTLYSSSTRRPSASGYGETLNIASSASVNWSMRDSVPDEKGTPVKAQTERTLMVNYSPSLFCDSGAAIGPSQSASALSIPWGSGTQSEKTAKMNAGEIAQLPPRGKTPYRSDIFDYPTVSVTAQVVRAQAFCRAWRVRRWGKRFDRILACVTARETATAFQAWQMQAQVISRHYRSVKRACFNALREYTRLTADFFWHMAEYLHAMLGQAEYSAAALWKVAQRNPVPQHPSLSTVPTFLYSSIYARLYRLYSINFIRGLKRNLRYWRSKREAARLLWKRSSRTQTRAVLVVWFRYSRLMAAERSLSPIPTFDEKLDEWDFYFSKYMRMASLTRQVAAMCVTAIVKRAFRRLQSYLFRAGSRKQMRMAVEFVVAFSQRTCFTTWASVKNVRTAQRFFFRLVFRRWQRSSRSTFQSMHLLERQLNSWVVNRSMRRCFRALRTHMRCSAMLAYAATRRIRSPFEQARVLRCVFLWRGDHWQVALVDSWNTWRAYTSRRQAFSTFITRHAAASRREQLMIAFSAFRGQVDRLGAQLLLTTAPYSMEACEDNGTVEAQVVDLAQSTFPDDGKTPKPACLYANGCALIEMLSDVCRFRYGVAALSQDAFS